MLYYLLDRFCENDNDNRFVLVCNTKPNHSVTCYFVSAFKGDGNEGFWVTHAPWKYVFLDVVDAGQNAALHCTPIILPNK